jgi:hypothetical protein
MAKAKVENQPIQKVDRTELKIHTLTVMIMPGSEIMFLQ